jgi:transposase-like protein
MGTVKSTRAKPKTWTEAEKRRLAKLVRNGVRAAQISTELDRYTGSVKRMAREMGLILKK